MNNLVELEYDSFENEKCVKLKDLVHASIIENTLKLDSQEVIVSFSALQEGMEEPKYFLWVNCANIQETLIKLNGEKTINKNQVCAEKNHSFCEITNEDLKMICDAHMVEIRVKNGDGHIDFTSEEILIGARAIYNAVVDENTYIDDIQRVEKERTERQLKLEREKLSEIEKFNQRIERIKQKGVNKYFSLNYDKFKQKLTVDIKEAVEFKQIEGSLLILEPKIGFRFVYTNEESSVLMIDFEAVSKRGLNLKNGELLFLLDQTKRLSLQPHESYSDPYLQEYHIESDWYEITADELKSLCEARVIEMRITNGNEYHDLTTEGIQLAARRFYNAVIDDTAYTDDLLTQEEREIAEHERIRKEREAQEAEEARIRAEKRAAWWAANKKKVGITILILIGVSAAIIGIKKITNIIIAKKAMAEAYELIEQGDQLVATYHFDEAYALYDSARKKTDDSEVQQKISMSTKKLAVARQNADAEYNKALNRLRILLDADDNEFNQYSNECLDKMIEIYSDREETIYYKNMRGK